MGEAETSEWLHCPSFCVAGLTGSKLIEYPIILEREEDGRYSVSAPDLPGCFSWGDNREQALERIREAMEVWIESAISDGEAIPAPGSSLAYVKIAS